jgi:CRP/FNR family transcriptional regulator, transcriptional activator FtrB
VTPDGLGRDSRSPAAGGPASGAPASGARAGASEPRRVLSELAPFAGVSQKSLDRLAGQAMLLSVPRGTMIFEQGDLPSAQVVLLAGTVHLLGRSATGQEMLVEAVFPPDPLLPAAVLESAPYLLRARAVEESRLLLLPAAALRAMIAAEPAVARGFLSCLARQFRRMTRQVKNLKLRTTTERLACYLLALAERQQGEIITLPYDKGAIAAELGMARESLSRALAILQADAIVVEGATVRIRDRDRLRRCCEPDPLIDGPD